MEMHKLFLMDATIKKIFEKHFVGNIPITRTGFEQKDFISEIKNKMELIDSLECKLKGHKKLDFTIKSSSQGYHDADFYLLFNKEDELCIRWDYRTESLIYKLDQIYTLPERMHNEYQRLEKNRIKRAKVELKHKKVKDLKKQSIISKIKTLAKEEKIKFYMTEKVGKMVFIFYLSENEELKIDIPNKRFKEAVDILPLLIKTISKLRNTGIRLKMRQQRYYRYRPSWI